MDRLGLDLKLRFSLNIRSTNGEVNDVLFDCNLIKNWREYDQR